MVLHLKSCGTTIIGMIFILILPKFLPRVPVYMSIYKWYFISGLAGLLSSVVQLGRLFWYHYHQLVNIIYLMLWIYLIFQQYLMNYIHQLNKNNRVDELLSSTLLNHIYLIKLINWIWFNKFPSFRISTYIYSIFPQVA